MADTIDPSSGMEVRIPEELLESKYAINRDEMLWRAYDKELGMGHGRERKALMIWHTIREAP